MNIVDVNNKSVTPSKVVCVGRNYREHIEELNNQIPTEPVIFIKPNSSISSRIGVSLAQPIDFESELTFLVRDQKLYAVGFGLDLTKRSLQQQLKSKRLPWERAKAFDGAAVFSPFVQLRGKVEDLSLQLTINGKTVQRGGCAEMIYQPRELLSEALSFLSFEDNDLLMTGTPAGVGQLKEGDVYRGGVFLHGKCVISQQWIVGKTEV